MKLIFLGPPGAGKGTQAQIICHKIGIPQVSTGDILRSAIASATPIGIKAKSYMDKGQLVPDEVVIDIIRDRLARNDAKKGYVLDGFPRTVPQARALDVIADIDMVINLDVPDESIIERLSGRRVCPNCGAPYHILFLNGRNDCGECGSALIQRDDDKPETIRRRLEEYHKKTAPLIDYYTLAGKIKTIQALGDVADIGRSILEAIEA